MDDWGEQLIGKSESTIAIFDLNTNEVKVLDQLPKDYSPSQVENDIFLIFNIFDWFLTTTQQKIKANME